MVTTPTRGDINWDVPLNAALNDLQNQVTTNASSITSVAGRVSTLENNGTYQPGDHGFITWSQDPATLRSAGDATTAGVLYLIKVKVPVAGNISNLHVGVVTAGSGLTSGQNLLGLYSNTGTLLATSGDMTAAFGSTGFKTGVITPVSATVTTYYLAVLTNGTTPPVLATGAGHGIASITNANLSTANSRWLTSGTGQTALPGSVTLSSATPNSGSRWGALT